MNNNSGASISSSVAPTSQHIFVCICTHGLIMRNAMLRGCCEHHAAHRGAVVVATGT